MAKKLWKLKIKNLRKLYSKLLFLKINDCIKLVLKNYFTRLGIG